jgi:hypothetical protein
MTVALADPSTASSGLKELMEYEAPWLEERCLNEDVASSSQEFQHFFAELKKYLWLAMNHQANLSMFSLRVDEVWHQFILFTHQYHQFCDRIFGQYVHHLPESSFIKRAKTPRDTFNQLYEAEFGTLPEVWLENTFKTCGPTGACSR